LPETDFA
jgi:short-subunit dehydrogenase